jgi:hypothetical protein
MYTRHAEYSETINASVERIFDWLDDQTRLSKHMSKRSWKLGWGKMETILDAQRGRAVGSHIVLRGRVFGIRLLLDEVVTTRESPLKKTWETVGEPRLLVMGPYRMGFDLVASGASARLRVAIDYELPAKGSRVCWVDSSDDHTRSGVRDRWCETRSRQWLRSRCWLPCLSKGHYIKSLSSTACAKRKPSACLHSLYVLQLVIVPKPTRTT